MVGNPMTPIGAGITPLLPDRWIDSLLSEMRDDSSEGGEFFDSIPQILADLNFFQICFPATIYIGARP